MATKSDFWDERYSVNEYVYGEHPNSYLKEQLDPLPIGSILFVGEGEGRNGVYAAKQGWKVSAYDLSVEGKKKQTSLHASTKWKLIIMWANCMSWVMKRRSLMSLQ